jgi:hypothetical protein
MTKKQKDIHELISLTDVSNLGKELIETLFKELTQDAKLNQIIKEEMIDEINFGELEDLLVPVYDRNFTHGDVKHMIAFYKTPVGKKLISVLPSITKETIAVGQTWGEKMAIRLESKIPNIIQRLAEREIEIENENKDQVYPMDCLDDTSMGIFDPPDEVIIDAQMDELDKILQARYKFVLDYIERKGWGTAETLTLPQIMEIRSQEGWKNPQVAP